MKGPRPPRPTNAANLPNYGPVAELYDRVRPGYPDALIDDVAGAVPGAVDVVEVGCGTGKASVPLAGRGLRVLGVEPNPAMAAVARRHLAGYSGCEVVEARFEDWEGVPVSADIVAAAQSWHWLDFDAGLAKARRVLRPGGALAVFANTPRPEETELRGALDRVYDRHAPDIARRSVMTWWSGGGPEEVRWEDRIAAGGFERPEDRHYDWACRYSTDEFVSLLRTHSDHWGRDALLAGIARVIDAAGGHITFPYRSLLLLATFGGNSP